MPDESTWVGPDVVVVEFVVASAGVRGRIPKRARGPTPPCVAEGLALLEHQTARAAGGRRMAAIGAAVGRTLDWRSGVASTLRQPAWREGPLVEPVRQHRGCLVPVAHPHRVVCERGAADCREALVSDNAIRTLTRFGFEVERADLIFGLVYDHNPRSRRAFEKAGYVEECRVQEPPGGKAGWSFQLAIGRENFLECAKPGPGKRGLG